MMSTLPAEPICVSDLANSPHRAMYRHRIDFSDNVVLNDTRKRGIMDDIEAETSRLRELQHDNIVKFLGTKSSSALLSSTSGSSPFEGHLDIFLEHVAGGSIAALLKNYGPFEEPLVRNFTSQLLKGVQYLHENNIIHGDIRGENVLVNSLGIIKITGFGILNKAHAGSLTAAAERPLPLSHGSVYWMAPEVVRHTSYTAKVDIWSVGCFVIEMLTAEHPWPQLTQTQAIFQLGTFAKPSFPSHISHELVDLLNSTFEIDSNLRPSAQDLSPYPWISGILIGMATDAHAVPPEVGGAVPAA